MAEANGLHILACTEDLYATSPEDILTKDSAGYLDRDSVDSLYEVQTFYEKMFLQMGLKITYLSFVIDKDGDFVYPEFDAAYWRSVEGPRRSFSHNPTKEV